MTIHGNELKSIFRDDDDRDRFVLKLAESVQDEDEYILKLSRYVHLDPVLMKKVKALPVRERVGILRAYPWKRILP